MRHETRKIEDFHEGYILVTDFRDVCAVLEIAGAPKVNDFGGALVKIDDSGADYAEVWAYEGIVPRIDKTAYRVR